MSHAHTGPVRDIDEDDDDAAEETISSDDVGTSLTAVDRASIDSQIATARRFPRSVTKSVREAVTLATADEETAASMMYSLKRGGKVIEGPSVRLAEIMSYSWGNLRVDADIVGEDGKNVTAMGTCFDLEKNVAIRVRVKRRITDKNGRKYNDDMIGTTSNAALSIALRNCVFRVIPVAIVDKVYKEARKASLGKGGTMAQKRQAAIEWWGKTGVKPEEVFALLAVQGLEDIGEDQLITLRGFANAVRDGEQTIENLFRASDKSEGTQDLNAALGNGKGQAPSAAAAAAGSPAKASAPKKSETPPAPAPRSACEECGAFDGQHKPDCKYFAD